MIPAEKLHSLKYGAIREVCRRGPRGFLSPVLSMLPDEFLDAHLTGDADFTACVKPKNQYSLRTQLIFQNEEVGEVLGYLADGPKTGFVQLGMNADGTLPRRNIGTDMMNRLLAFLSAEGVDYFATYEISQPHSREYFAARGWKFVHGKLNIPASLENGHSLASISRAAMRLEDIQDQPVKAFADVSTPRRKQAFLAGMGLF